VLLPFLLCAVPVPAAEDGAWTHPLTHRIKLNSPLVEVTPFVFHDRLYLLENWQKQWEFPGSPDGSHFQEDEVRIRDVELDRVVATPFRGHGLGMAFVWQGRVHVFAGNWGTEKKWNISEIEMTSSSDLQTWTSPRVVLKAEPSEKFFNVSVCRGDDAFALLVESNDPKWPPFTFKYFTSSDLHQWAPVPGGLYGTNKYVGGPALYHEGHWYYTLYLESLGSGAYETRITRSRDLVRWEDAPPGRPFVPFNPTNTIHSLRPAGLREKNASDAEVVYWRGRTLVYFTGGDQQLAGDLQRAEFAGTPAELFERFFSGGHPGGPGGLILPSDAQLRWQEYPLGACFDFGMATYAGGDETATPPASVFNPVRIDAGRWLRVPRLVGIRRLVVTAKQRNGFCLWPTATTDYSVKSSPWLQGRGDLVGDLLTFARLREVARGIRVAMADHKFGCWASTEPDGRHLLHGDREAYFKLLTQQLRELLTSYGPLTAVWLDTTEDPFGPDVRDPLTGAVLGGQHAAVLSRLIRDLQPGANLLGMPDADVQLLYPREGAAPYPLHYAVAATGQPGSSAVQAGGRWVVPEVDFSPRSPGRSLPRGDSETNALMHMVAAYYDVVGRGANLLIGIRPEAGGLIPDAEADLLEQFGTELRMRLSHPIARLDAPVIDPSGLLELDLVGEREVTLLTLEEDLSQGQRVDAYQIEIRRGREWVRVAEGLTVGRMRIQPLQLVRTDRIRVRFTRTLAPPMIRRLAVFGRPEPIREDDTGS
jgi:alpha-L-fucosidase